MKSAFGSQFIPDLWQQHRDGSIWQYLGGGLYSWAEIEGPHTINTVGSLWAGGGFVYEIRADRSIWRYDTIAGGAWVELDSNPATVRIAAGANGHVYQMHNDSTIWSYQNGAWILLDDNPNVRDFGAGGDNLFQIHYDGTIWQYDGGGYHSWSLLDNNAASNAIVVSDNGTLYQTHTDSSVWKYEGGGLYSWTFIDDDPTMWRLAAGGDNLYEVDILSSGEERTWLFASGTWTLLEDINPSNGFIAPARNDLYKIHSDNTIWRFNGGYLGSWSLLDNNPQTVWITGEL